MKKTILSLALGLGLTASSLLPAQAQEAVVKLADQKRALAQDLSKQYHALSSLLRTEINQYDLDISASELMQAPGISPKMLTRSDQLMRSAKGLTQTSDTSQNLIQLRLADASMLMPWQNGQSPLFAFAPDGDDKEWQAIEAYDVHGKRHLLDVYALPQQPVFVVELNGKATLKEGLAVMRSTFAKANLDTNKLAKSLKQVAASQTAPISTTVLTNIHLKNDEEPWISGAAEVYAIVTGVSPSRDKPVLDIMEMPYLDYDGTTYHPNQILIHWERYRWQAADILLMEHDDGTNYKTLASALLKAAEAIMRLIPDVSSYAVIPQITNGVLQAMPDSWFTNDDDYVDVFYTLFEGQTYHYRSGASNNATATFTPLVINPR